ncbi:MAG TPA: UDP-N-acetylmuramoyl-L-alanyl-D-glutamate--2,6-diaminopimelate ligase [Bacteroidales bacterium]|nr:UDP-N-acetylmuramoyl-L-alanyl-D-glutamate--2,6-diaminopimelate ligase [Bacteroidales bacterium]
MKTLQQLFQNISLVEIRGSTDLTVDSVEFDSRKVKPNGLFVAIKGLTTDGHQYINQAIANGAVCVVCEKIPDDISPELTCVSVNDSARALGLIASNFYDNPSEKLNLIGVTGTNGKTTVVSLLYELFTKLGHHCGLLSTVQNMIVASRVPATHTTPDPLQINSLLRKMVDAGCDYAFMEVSSHAIVQQRVAGLTFSGGVFTNITHDHLDFHKTFANYLGAKKSFFDSLSPGAFAITNIDDRNGNIMLQNTRAVKRTYSLHSMADFRAKVIESTLNGLLLLIDEKEVWFRLVGEFNAYNLLSVYATARMLGHKSLDVLTTLSTCGSVRGRFECFKGHNGITGIVDYAHTPDALQNVLNTILAIRSGSAKIITVVGCGGNRDSAKRPTMAAIAARASNTVVLTSDNPRFENPAHIIEEMKGGLDASGLRKSLVIENRYEAIKTACALAEPGDIVMIAGKGHESYQEILGVKYPFDDMKVLKEFLT